MTHYAVDGEAQLALDLALELAFKQAWLIQGLVRALEEGHGRPGHSLRGLPHLQNLLLKPPPHQSHFLTGCLSRESAIQSQVVGRGQRAQCTRCDGKNATNVC